MKPATNKISDSQLAVGWTRHKTTNRKANMPLIREKTPKPESKGYDLYQRMTKALAQARQQGAQPTHILVGWEPLSEMEIYAPNGEETRVTLDGVPFYEVRLPDKVEFAIATLHSKHEKPIEPLDVSDTPRLDQEMEHHSSGAAKLIEPVAV